MQTVGEARAHLERNGSRVVAATLHETDGDRRVWFVGRDGWCHLASDAALIEAASRALSLPLVTDGTRPAVEWPAPHA